MLIEDCLGFCQYIKICSQNYFTLLSSLFLFCHTGTYFTRTRPMQKPFSSCFVLFCFFLNPPLMVSATYTLEGIVGELGHFKTPQSLHNFFNGRSISYILIKTNIENLRRHLAFSLTHKKRKPFQMVFSISIHEKGSGQMDFLFSSKPQSYPAYCL